MVKVTSRDVLAILRRFDVANDDNVPRHIEQLKLSHPSPTNTLVSFRFNRRGFYALFDDNADDDSTYILAQIRLEKPDEAGTVAVNPNDSIHTFGLPFKGKDVYLVEAISTKKRLDTLLAERYPDTSRSTWQKHIKAGHVSVNGEIITAPKHDSTDYDTIALDLPPTADYSENTLPIVYLDDNVIVINKPVGVLTHAKGALNDEFTVAEFFRRYTTYGLDTNRPGIVHRLDRDTSGVMVGARNPQTAALLQKQFASRQTKKTYVAVVDGVPDQPAAQIDLPIGRNTALPSTFRVNPGGKPAQTTYRVLRTDGQHSLVDLQPHTGRTHQLRVHMAYLHTPIHGDRVYGGQPADRLYLHASKLEITIPYGDRRVFEVPAPSEFTNFINPKAIND